MSIDKYFVLLVKIQVSMYKCLLAYDTDEENISFS